MGSESPQWWMPVFVTSRSNFSINVPKAPNSCCTCSKESHALVKIAVCKMIERSFSLSWQPKLTSVTWSSLRMNGQGWVFRQEGQQKALIFLNVPWKYISKAVLTLLGFRWILPIHCTASHCSLMNKNRSWTTRLGEVITEPCLNFSNRGQMMELYSCISVKLSCC